ncbi:MAG: hypothetical protein ACI8XM_000250 [Haloarculaceae archaeon]|jgi:hypothetical protein
MGLWDDATGEVRETAATGGFGGPAILGESLYSAGEAIPDDAEDNLRDVVAEDGTVTQQVAVNSALMTEDGVNYAEQATDDVTDATDPTNWLPWWTSYAAAGVGLLVLLVVLGPYAELGAEVAG